MPLITEELHYEADSLAMRGHFAWNDGITDPAPGILVFPEAFGLGDHAKQRAERLAEEYGFPALACDLHGEGRIVDALDQVMPLLEPLRTSPEKVRARTIKPLEALMARPQVNETRMAAIGFCFGGTMAYELALAGADIKAAIGFHSGLEVTSPQDAKQIKGKIMALIGADDPGIPPEQRAAFEAMLREGGVDWQMHLYGGVVHSFTNKNADKRGMPDFLRYDAAADERSWASMTALLEETLLR